MAHSLMHGSVDSLSKESCRCHGWWDCEQNSVSECLPNNMIFSPLLSSFFFFFFLISFYTARALRIAFLFRFAALTASGLA